MTIPGDHARNGALTREGTHSECHVRGLAEGSSADYQVPRHVLGQLARAQSSLNSSRRRHEGVLEGLKMLADKPGFEWLPRRPVREDRYLPGPSRRAIRVTGGLTEDRHIYHLIT